MIDLCKIFGVEEGEEFRIKHKEFVRFIYKIVGDSLMFRRKEEKDFWFSDLSVNALPEIENIIKLPKRKEFTDDELFILKKLNKAYKWIARDSDGDLYTYINRPSKDAAMWRTSRCKSLSAFNDLFQSIKWEDEEPVCIEDYVER